MQRCGDHQDRAGPVSGTGARPVEPGTLYLLLGLAPEPWEWDGPLGPPSSSNASRRRQRLAEGKQHGAYNHKASIPPLVGYGLDADAHVAARQPRWKSFPRWMTTCGTQPAW